MIKQALQHMFTGSFMSLAITDCTIRQVILWSLEEQKNPSTTDH